MARQVADEYSGLVAGGISQTPTYLSNIGKEKVQEQFKKQIEVFVKNNVDFLICEVREVVKDLKLFATQKTKDLFSSFSYVKQGSETNKYLINGCSCYGMKVYFSVL